MIYSFNLTSLKSLFPISALALLFGCTISNLPPTDAELISAALVTPAVPVVPNSTPVPPAVEAETEGFAENPDSSYPAPAADGAVVVEPAGDIENQSYPAPTQVVLADSPAPAPEALHVSSSTSAVTEAVPLTVRPDGSLELGWADLIPSGFTADSIYQKYEEQLAEIPAGDPKGQELRIQMQEEFNNGPTNETLNGKLVRIPGFVTALDYADDSIKEFLLVPYFGACIHVPAPPVNQTVYVSTASGDEISVQDAYGPIWVVGVLQTESTSTDLATAGYTIQDATIEYYSDQQ